MISLLTSIAMLVRVFLFTPSASTRVFAQENQPSESLTSTASISIKDTPSATSSESSQIESTPTITSPTPLPTPNITQTPTPEASITPTITDAIVNPSTDTPMESIQDTRLSSSSNWTFEKVELNKEYIAPQNNQVKLLFTKLPNPSGNIKIEEITLTEEQIIQTGSVTNKAYDITSDMTDGDFTYNLSLPIPKTVNDAPIEIKFAEEISKIDSLERVSNTVIQKDDIVSVENLNHFTVFIVASPNTTLNSSELGTTAWTNPTRIKTSNNYNATVSLDGTTSQYLKAIDYGFAIPLSAVIEGIVVSIERKSSSTANGGSKDAAVRLIKNGTVGTADRSTSTTYSTVNNVYEDHGGPTDLWGESWTPEDINDSTFGVAFAATKPNSAGNAQTVYVDHIKITVYYNTPPLASLDTSATNEDTAIDIDTSTLLANDTDVDIGDTLSIISVENPVNGTVGFSDSLVTFTPSSNYNGEDAHFEYTVSDGTATDTGVVTISVSPVNDAPAFDPVSDQVINENSSSQNVFLTNVSPGPSDEMSQEVSLSATSSDPSIVPDPTIEGSGATRTLSYAPLPDTYGSVVITITADDLQSENNTFSRTFSITVIQDTTPPIITILGDNPVTVEINSLYIDAGANASDTVDGDISTTITIDDSEVDTSSVGTYTVYFDVQDASGNSALQQTRTVTVIDSIADAFAIISANLSATGSDIANNLNLVNTNNVENFSDLYFEKSIDGMPLGRLTFTNALDLSATATQEYLQHLGNNLDQANGRIALSTTESEIFAATGATLEMYDITSFVTDKNLVVRNDSGTILTPTDIISGFIYDSLTKKIIFNTAHFTQFDIDTSAPTTPVATPANGDYTTNQLVTLQSSDELSGLEGIYYTLDGSTPDNSKTLYTGSIEIDHSLTLRAIAYDTSGNASEILTTTYGIAPVISNETLSRADDTILTIRWFTDDPSTSRVVYDTVSHATLGASPDYGYAYSTIEDDTKVTSHVVTIYGLTTGVTYYYRVISHGSPETIGEEQAYALHYVYGIGSGDGKSDGKSDGRSSGGGGGGTSGGGAQASLVLGATTSFNEIESGNVLGEEIVEAKPGVSISATPKPELGQVLAETKAVSKNSPVWFFIVGAALLLIAIWWKRKK